MTVLDELNRANLERRGSRSATARTHLALYDTLDSDFYTLCGRALEVQASEARYERVDCPSCRTLLRSRMLELAMAHPDLGRPELLVLLHSDLLARKRRAQDRRDRVALRDMLRELAEGI